MGRRKIEIKAIKDDRNRSVTFLKRKGGLFKKAHELSVLCSVDVAVFIFGSNKKLYEYSSSDMRDLITRYTYHGGPNEHKGPSDFNGGADDEEEDDENGTPPQGDGMDPHMLPPHFQTQPSFPHLRHHTPSASPPIPNGVFGPHPGNGPRGHTPQPQMGSRPSSRNDIRRIGPMVGQPVGPPGAPQPAAVNGFAFMPQPAIYNPQNPPNMPPNLPPHGMPQQHPHPQYPYPAAHPHPHPHQHPHQMHPFVEEQQRSSVPPNFPPQPQGPPAARHSVSPPQPPPQQLPQQLPQQPVPHMSPPQAHPMHSPPQPHQHVPPPPPQEPPHIVLPPQEPQPPAPMESRPKHEPVKKAPPNKGGSIFTPIDENRSILSQHLAAFHPEVKSEAPSSRSQSIDVGSVSRGNNTGSPPIPQRSSTQGQPQIKRNGSLSSIPETVFTPPSRSNSLRVGGGSISRPRLKVQIPDESDGGSATAESASPRGTTATDATSQPSRRPDSHSSGVVLPPPSPSASALLSAGATGPPNPFARPPPHQNNNMNIDTPVSALPSRFLNNEFLPSPSSFYPEWNFRGSDSNTLPSPLNFSTPVGATGPSFLREDAATHKRKSPEISGSGSHTESADLSEAKRVKVDS
ncbi:resistance to lethality of mkk1p386 overexpression [Madurella fahalii]|uniref:Resistance to lethality of mkk1p386 overexpression n=1 Tax=Madurella fahalii TaxID=1157608 RepID=A0ABQ0FYG4_9PEZI